MQENMTEQVNREESDKGFSVPKFAGFDQLPFRDLLPTAPFHEKSQYGSANTSQDIENTTSPTGCSDFYPITPQKPLRREITDQERVLVKTPESCRVQRIEAVQEHVKESQIAAEFKNRNNEIGDNEPEKPKRRRKHRPKVITQDKQKTTPKTPTQNPSKPAEGTKETPSCKRKYVRKKGVNIDSASTPVKAGVQSRCLISDKKVCRSLNLEDEQPTDGSSIQLETQEQGCSNGENQSSSNFRLVNNVESAEDIASRSAIQELKECVSPLTVESVEDIASCSADQELKECVSPLAEGQAPRTPLPNKSKPTKIKRLASILEQPGTDGRNCALLHQSCPVFISEEVGQAQENKLHASASASTGCSNQKQNSMKKRPMEADSIQIPGQFAVSCNGRPQTSTKAVTVSKVKRSKTSQEPRMHENFVIEQYYQFLATSAAADELCKQMRSLDINRESPYVPYQNMALVPSAMNNQNQNALVPCRGDNTIVLFSPVKKRPLRPRVNLDDETSKVWNLLMGNINSEGINGTDEEKARWWDEERRVLQGRADSFIARMHLVQGDRRFTAWKGSVVDSVVGVFLTQNVSDHLSSSAFMSMAARFAFQSDNSLKPEEAGSLTTHVNIQSQSCDGLVSSTNDSVSNITNSSASGSDACDDSNAERSSIKLQGKEPMYLDRDSNATPDMLVSNSGQDKLSSFNAQPTFMELMRMAESSTLHGHGKHNTTEEKISTNKDIHVQTDNSPPKSNGKRETKNQKDQFDWDSLRREAEGTKGKRSITESSTDSVDWEAVRTADVDEIAKTIKDRGMNNVLAGRIQDFLNRIVRDHGSIDLEWLRDVPPDKAKEYLLSIRGLGLKSVECVRLLTLHHLAFPVDTNVGRIAVRLGWVPLQPLPESLQLHLLELYPVQATIQKYLWPRLCKLDQKTLYELHYQMITFGKVFCTKSKPNCNACPMRGDCRHFASAFASARLALPGPQEKSIVGANRTPELNRATVSDQVLLPLPPAIDHVHRELRLEEDRQFGSTNVIPNSEPIIEEPATPEPECIQVHDIEDAFWEDPDEIPTIKLDMEQFTSNLKTYMQQNMELHEGDMSKALVALTAEAASIPMPKLKNVSQLRTEHQVYELPDYHPLLEGLDKREPDDPCSYLLAIWTPGETAESIQAPDRKCRVQEDGKLCDEFTCFSCNSLREARSQTVRGTLLIPCRTAMRGSFPLNGTYFQVNEVFADHDSSINPIDVPRDWIWNLPRKTVFFGTSIPSIFKGLTTEDIQHCFWRGYVCVRGFDQKTRAPRPLMARLHFPASKLSKARGNNNAKAANNTDGPKLNPEQNK